MQTLYVGVCEIAYDPNKTLLEHGLTCTHRPNGLVVPCDKPLLRVNGAGADAVQVVICPHPVDRKWPLPPWKEAARLAVLSYKPPAKATK
jgi:hypothetical protein